MVLEKTLESPLDCKEIQPVHSNGDQPWVFFGRNDAKAETPVLWPLHGKYMGKQQEHCQTLFLGGSKITTDGDCSHEIKRRLLLGRKAMTILYSLGAVRDWGQEEKGTTEDEMAGWCH